MDAWHTIWRLNRVYWAPSESLIINIAFALTVGNSAADNRGQLRQATKQIISAVKSKQRHGTHALTPWLLRTLVIGLTKEMGDENEEQSLHGEELLTPVVSAVSAAASEALFAGPCFRITAGLDGLTLPTGDRTHSTPATVGGRATLSSGEAAGAVTIFYDDGAAVELAGGDGGGGGGAGGNAESSSLAALAAACEPAPFGRGQENVLDPSFRRAVKLEPGRFATTFDVAATGILFDIQRLLVPAAAELRAELYKMHVYGPGDFFKAHVDTPRGEGHVARCACLLYLTHAACSRGRICSSSSVLP